MAILSPSILGANPLALERDISDTKAAGVRWLHIDVMDGSFVPNLSFGYSVVEAIDKAFGDMMLDVHLMIDEPIRYVDRFSAAGADYITVHIEADTPENISLTVDKIIANGKKAGISIKPATDIEAIRPLLDKLSLVLVMTVEPGFGGQKFKEEMMPKITALRKLLDEVNPDCHIEVDGGIDLVTGEICKAAGADVLVAGSAFYKAQDKAAFRAAIEK